MNTLVCSENSFTARCYSSRYFSIMAIEPEVSSHRLTSALKTKVDRFQINSVLLNFIKGS